MGDQVLLLLLGFVLTSVAGGLITFYFQIKTAERNLRETERQAATTVFDEISRAMDRRLYRMWQLQWGLESGDEDRMDRALGEYRKVLVEWNDNLNRNLALTYRYFGEGVWRYVDRALYEEFAQIGRLLEFRYRGLRGVKHGSTKPVPEARIAALNGEIYLLNRFMVSLIQIGRVGLYQVANTKKWPEPPPWEAELKDGSRGPRVTEWQRDLSMVLKSDGELAVDGLFGRATRDATVALQQTHGLEPDGVVGHRTRQMMDDLLPDFISPTW
jgi:peptidoglycan hydrolase-like protein with peptidoglycan-binding domain